MPWSTESVELAAPSMLLGSPGLWSCAAEPSFGGGLPEHLQSSPPQTPSRLAAVNRMLAAETERLQGTARQLKQQHGHLLSRAPAYPVGVYPPAAPSDAVPIDLRSPRNASPRDAPPRAFWQPPKPSQPVPDNADLVVKHREAQETMQRLQTELGLAEASLSQACADGVQLQAIEARAAQREVEQYYEMEMRQVRSEHRAREDVLEHACEQLRRASKAEVERAVSEFREAELREHRTRSDLDDLQISLRRLQSDRDTDRSKLEKLQTERGGLVSEVCIFKSEFGELRAAELEDRLSRQRAELNSRAMAEEKLRLHADRGRLREAHQQAERSLQAEAQALRDARRALERARNSEEESERRRKLAVAEVTNASGRAKHPADVVGEDVKLADLIRAELTEFVEESSLERRNWQEEAQRNVRQRDFERKSRGELEATLHSLMARLECLIVQSPPPRAPDARLQTELSESRAQTVSLEASLEQERCRRQAEREASQQAEADERLAREEVERRCQTATMELEMLRAEVQRMQTAHDVERQISQQHLSRNGSSEARRHDEELTCLRRSKSELELALSRDRRALREAQDECKQLRSDLLLECRSREDAEAKLCKAVLAASAPAAPALPSAGLVSQQRHSSGHHPGRRVRVQGVEFISPTHNRVEVPSPQAQVGNRAAVLPLSCALGPNRRRTLFQQELAQLPKSLREMLAASIREPLDDVASADFTVSAERERSLMIRLYVVMEEMLDLPSSTTSGPAFQRFWSFLQKDVEVTTSPWTSEGTRTPPEVSFEEGRPSRLL